MIAISRDEERTLEFRRRAEEWHDDGLLSAGELETIPRSSWRFSRFWTRIGFFVLASMATQMLFGLLLLLSLPKGYITALLAVGLAELLINKKKFLRTGIEEGFYISGLCAFIFGLPSSGKPEAVLVFVAAFLIAGMRLAQSIFLAGSVLLTLLYIGIKSEAFATTGAFAFAFVMLMVAIRSARTLRPSFDRAAMLLTIILIPLGSLLMMLESVPHDVPAALAIPFALGSLGVVAWGVRGRDHALIVAGALSLIVSTVFLLEPMNVEVEWLLIGAGIVSLVAMLSIQRRLHGRAVGLTSDKLYGAAPLDIIELAASTALTPAAANESTAGGPNVTSSQTGGSFGGAGSTGEY